MIDLVTAKDFKHNWKVNQPFVYKQTTYYMCSAADQKRGSNVYFLVDIICKVFIQSTEYWKLKQSALDTH